MKFLKVTSCIEENSGKFQNQRNVKTYCIKFSIRTQEVEKSVLSSQEMWDPDAHLKITCWTL